MFYHRTTLFVAVGTAAAIVVVDDADNDYTYIFLHLI